jgi:hypothetical protein
MEIAARFGIASVRKRAGFASSEPESPACFKIIFVALEELGPRNPARGALLHPQTSIAHWHGRRGKQIGGSTIPTAYGRVCRQLRSARLSS